MPSHHPNCGFYDPISSPCDCNESRGRQLISSDHAVKAKCQHKTPCSDCPWARMALNGWLGGASVDEWLRTAHSDQVVECHTLTGVQCAGLAIYRANVAKSCPPPMLKLPKDTEKVFGFGEFKAHHEAPLSSNPRFANPKADSFGDWYHELSEVASEYGVSVADADAWRECFDAGQSPDEAFYDEYPEYRLGDSD